MEQNQWERLWTNLSKISYVVARSLLRRRGFRSCQKKKIASASDILSECFCFFSLLFVSLLLPQVAPNVWNTGEKSNFDYFKREFSHHCYRGEILSSSTWRTKRKQRDSWCDFLKGYVSLWGIRLYTERWFFFFFLNTWQLSSFFMKGTQRWSRLGFLGSLSWHKSAPRLNNLILSILGVVSSALTLVIPQK